MDYSETLTSRQRVLRAINHQQADRVPIDLGGFQTGIHKKACLKRAKSEAGLSDYEVRTWADWHHHQTLSLIALWFLILETRRGKKYTPALTVPQVRIILYALLRQACDRRYPGWARRYIKQKSKRRELARFYHYKRHKLLAPLRVKERK